MKNQLSSFLLIAAILVLISATTAPQQTFDKITVREFELVDSRGQKRVSIKTEDDGAVVFRMVDTKGTIRVKVAADDDGSGLVLLDGDTNVGVHALVNKDDRTLKVVGKDGKERKL